MRYAGDLIGSKVQTRNVAKPAEKQLNGNPLANGLENGNGVHAEDKEMDRVFMVSGYPRLRAR